MAPHPYQEVVIDGDTSTDEEEAVVLIAPHARNRRRLSAILDDDDEREPEPQRTAAQSQPTLFSRAVNDVDDDDDDVEIIQITTPPSDEGAKRKSRRLTILDSDEEPEPPVETKRTLPHRDVREEIDDERRPARASPSGGRGVKTALTVEPVRRSSLSQGPHASGTPHGESGSGRESTSSSSRKSSRIEHKKKEKEKLGPRVRKLEFLSLDNCLDHTTERRALRDDDSDFIVDDEEEEASDDEVEEVAEPPRKRPRQQPSRERTYADGDDDLDDFIAGDDEVEYMDEDEVGVMDQASSGDEVDTREDDENVRVLMQSREPSEWFAIYLRYLEESILDEELDNKMRRSHHKLEYQLFKQATNHIERAICSRRDSLRSSVVWNDDIMENLHCATRFFSTRCSVSTDCQACRRANHYATQLVQFGGFACDATALYKDNWMKKLRAAVDEQVPVRDSFELGSVCHARTLGFWQLLHAKHFWVVIVDAKRRESGDADGRIEESERKAFYKAEYGRYKRLINLVDKFSTETTQSVHFMPNVWKKVTPTHVQSEFLPGGGRSTDNSAAPRRGTMDSLVGDSDDDFVGSADEEEEEEVELDEPPKETKRQSLNDPHDSAATESDSASPSHRSTPSKKTRQSSIVSSFNGQSTSRLSPQSERTKADAAPAKPMTDSKTASASELEAEDLLCLVCGENQRDGAIAHGNYLHFYCCFRCAKRQHTSNHRCMVCDRPIDRVFRILPLSREARADIVKQRQAA